MAAHSLSGGVPAASPWQSTLHSSNDLQPVMAPPSKVLELKLASRQKPVPTTKAGARGGEGGADGGDCGGGDGVGGEGGEGGEGDAGGGGGGGGSGGGGGGEGQLSHEPLQLVSMY